MNYEEKERPVIKAIQMKGNMERELYKYISLIRRILVLIHVRNTAVKIITQVFFNSGILKNL